MCNITKICTPSETMVEPAANNASLESEGSHDEERKNKKIEIDEKEADILLEIINNVKEVYLLKFFVQAFTVENEMPSIT